MFIDSHVHLDRDEFAGDRAAVMDRAAAAGVRLLLNVGYDLASSERAVALAQTDPRVVAAVGIHPHDAASVAGADGRVTRGGLRLLERLAELAVRPGVVAIGEIGLDFYRDLSPRPAQAAAMAAQVDLARRLDLPVILHVRDAWPEALDAVEAAGVPPRGGVLHAFSGDADAVAWAQRHGFLLGIGGPITYPKSRLPAIVAGCAADRLLLETDAPWLPPVPHRGRRNEPAWLPLVAARVGEILGLDAPAIGRLTSRAFARLFRMPAPEGGGEACS